MPLQEGPSYSKKDFMGYLKVGESNESRQIALLQYTNSCSAITSLLHACLQYLQSDILSCWSWH